MVMTLSGDGTITGLVPGGLPTASILYEDLQSVTAGKVLGRNTSGAGVVQELPIAVDSGGAVGMGTTTPTQKLDVRGALASVGNGVSTVLSYSTAGIVGTFTAHDLTLFANTAEQARLTTGGLFKFNSGYGSVATAYGCRAWVNFAGTGTTSTNQSMRGQGNVSSVFKNAAGDYTVNFATAMPDANYSIALSGLNSTADVNNILRITTGYASATTSCAIYAGDNTSDALVDLAYINVSIFR